MNPIRDTAGVREAILNKVMIQENKVGIETKCSDVAGFSICQSGGHVRILVAQLPEQELWRHYRLVVIFGQPSQLADLFDLSPSRQHPGAG